MAYWLIKSEPDVWSWEDQVKAGAKGTPWTGVRNHLAKINLKTMKKGDGCFFYHSNTGKEIVGLCEVVREAYADPTAEPGTPWVCVDVKAMKPLKSFVTLADVKQSRRLQKMALITSARLSVQPVTADEWAIILQMGGV